MVKWNIIFVFFHVDESCIFFINAVLFFIILLNDTSDFKLIHIHNVDIYNENDYKFQIKYKNFYQKIYFKMFTPRLSMKNLVNMASRRSTSEDHSSPAQSVCSGRASSYFR